VDIRHVLMLVFDGVVDMGVGMRERKVIRIRMMLLMMSLVMRMRLSSLTLDRKMRQLYDFFSALVESACSS
jgi:hypothetical protein